jgi:hypothetical protein
MAKGYRGAERRSVTSLSVLSIGLLRLRFDMQGARQFFLSGDADNPFPFAAFIAPVVW